MTSDKNTVVIGKRQILREVGKNNVLEIRIAANADKQYIESLIEIAKQGNVKYSIGGTMEEISLQYGIDVPSGAVGVLK